MMPSSKVLEIELRVDVALRLRTTQLEHALAAAEARNEVLWQAARRYRRFAISLEAARKQREAIGDRAVAMYQEECAELLRERLQGLEMDRDAARATVELRAVETAYMRAERNAAWQTCAQLAAALRETTTDWRDWRNQSQWEMALALVQPQCNHPLSAITRNPDRTQICRACAALDAADLRREMQAVNDPRITEDTDGPQ